ncbi:MAG: YqgE/AlgH family protein [Pseudomonadota bacterium]
MTSLTGQTLIAMPGMGDPRFEKSVIFLCDHSEDGAMGLIVNKPAPEISFADLLRRLDIAEEAAFKLPVHFGGPMEAGRGFVLHSEDYCTEGGTLSVGDGVAMTATLDILRDIAELRGPSKAFLALGYAGWAPGQLETELQMNGWLTSSADPEIIFSEDNEAKWSRALAALGVDPLSLSAVSGRA